MPLPDPLFLRDATPADAGVLAALYNAAIEAGLMMRDGQPRSEAVFRRVLVGLGAREACVLLEDDGVVLGWGVLRRYSDRAGYRFCGETFIYVRPDVRRRGYGAQIHQALVARARRYRYHHLMARVWAANTESLTFYEHAGYEAVGVQREIGTLHGRRHDLVVLQRVLEEAEPEGL